MAEQITEQDLLEQAKKIQEDASKRIKDLKEKAKELRQKKLIALGELTIKFLKDEIKIEELKTFINENNLTKEKTK